ncbi:COPII-coated vesicle component Erv25 [Schizosaccharomyces cryophilus OY26]|uniref:COPII-coated vesicle component Erv25 n=1 Tax=Schizosaccharomyces cryophilus (strain OY26 / ATCC MYA-4695 / CBS 11777 / NBRC 106824 / NRRL Y48691) TaxID=653667 RepID=S9VXT4_SCHCR|nr:COPII-coated vesicle component Erv25 [Schizosaccharomyces cryophilus OY26]EPY51024.1 COPII-coated vesicle component Erv25 [Schizosaccharomyces cryophilus OY26]
MFLFKPLILLFSLIVCSVQAVHFDIPAESNPQAFCLREYAGEKTLMIVSVRTSGNRGDGQKLSMEIKDSQGTIHSSVQNLIDEERIVSEVSGPTVIDICFMNTLTPGAMESNHKKRSVKLDFNIGADAQDYSALQKAYNLEPVEADLQRAKDFINEVKGKMYYLQTRETKFRNTNESTNERVKNFAYFTFITLIVLVTWQILYLRSFFQRKHLIP